MNWLTHLGGLADNWGKIVGALVVTLGLTSSSWYLLDTRWDQRAIAGDARQLQGQLNYQVNELKLGQAKQNLETWQQRWLDFQLKPPAEQNSPMGRQYRQVIDDKIEQYKKEVVVYERALQRAKSK